MQCLARAVARSARATAEGYGRQRFLATGRAAAKSYDIKRRPVVVNARALGGGRRAISDSDLVDRILGEVRATNAELAKQQDAGLVAELARRLGIHVGL